MTRIKFCGLTHPEDVTCAVALGADALGFVFYPPSPRALTADQAIPLTRLVPAFVTRVGLFVDADHATIQEAFDKNRLNLVQYHGNESPTFCAEVGLPYIRAIRVRPGVDVVAEMARYTGCQWIFVGCLQAGGARWHGRVV